MGRSGLKVLVILAALVVSMNSDPVGSSSCGSCCDYSIFRDVLSSKLEKARHELEHLHQAVCDIAELVTKSQECEKVTGIEYHYNYLLSAVDVSRIDFCVQATNDAHISLSPVASDNAEMYEIVIGGWDNTKSVIRRCAQCPEKTASHETGLVDANQFRGFWITFDYHSGRLAVGKAEQSAPFMEWVDRTPINVKYIGFSTGWGSTGVFRYLCSI